MEEMFEDMPKGIAREIPKDYNKPDYYARKTCNYLTSVGEVTESINRINYYLNLILSSFATLVYHSTSSEEKKTN